MNETSKIYAGILGLVIGDAVGVPVEFEPRDTFKVTDMTGYGTFNMPPGTWSDDSSLTLATVESIARLGRVDAEDIMNNFYRWVGENAFTPYGMAFDIGRTTLNAIQRYAGGLPAAECGGKGDRDNGNGSLMRILPLAFTDCRYKTVDAVSALTHAHEKSLEACRIYISVARKLLRGKPLDSVVKSIKTELPAYERLPVLETLSREEIKSSGYVADTLEAALWCNLKSKSYRECVLLAVNLGEDTDTVAAVAGGLAGIIYGIGEEKGIPQNWIDRTARIDWIKELCGKFEEAIERKQSLYEGLGKDEEPVNGGHHE